MKNKGKKQPGIYVEIFIRATIDDIWQLTKDPALHQRWDLRFHQIRYLPRAKDDPVQRFLYETRIGFGLTIKGTGESVGVRALDSGETTSSLKFASEDHKSLIKSGSGYWRYIPAENGLRFLTWYDYQTRFGALGKWTDVVLFRPLMGWATAWSFDRLRLWAECSQSPECSLTLATIHAISRFAIAFVWIWHGLIPKLLVRHIDERTMLIQSGVALSLLRWIGGGEILIGVLFLYFWKSRRLFLLTALLMALATAAVAVKSPNYVVAAFNPVTLNVSVMALSIAGWLSSSNIPYARRCLRRDPRVQL